MRKHTRRVILQRVLWAMTWLTIGPIVSAQEQGLVIFDFEDNPQEWAIPDWATEGDGYVAETIEISQDVASHGAGSLQILAHFPGEKWTGAYVEVMMRVTDWGQFGAVATDVFLPPNAPRGLESRFILSVGDKWEWTEMNRAIPLEPGKWTTVSANLKPGSLDWKFFPTDMFRKDIRKVGIRIESNKRPVYSGPIYVDNIRLVP